MRFVDQDERVEIFRPGIGLFGSSANPLQKAPNHDFLDRLVPENLLVLIGRICSRQIEGDDQPIGGSEETIEDPLDRASAWISAVTEEQGQWSPGVRVELARIDSLQHVLKTSASVR